MTKQLKKQIQNTINFLEKHDWTTGALARDSKGKPVYNPLSKNAVRFCVLGAFLVANRKKSAIGLYNAFEDKFNQDLIEYNDEKAHGKKRLIAKLRKLIKD